MADALDGEKKKVTELEGIVKTKNTLKKIRNNLNVCLYLKKRKRQDEEF